MARAVSTHIRTYTSTCKYKKGEIDILYVVNVHVHIYRDDVYVQCGHLYR